MGYRPGVILLVQAAVLALILTWRWRGLTGRQLLASEGAAGGRVPLGYTRKAKGRVQQRQVGLASRRVFPLVVVRERWYHRLLKRLGLAAELQLGDAALDARWFIVTDDPERLRRALASPPLRAQLGELLALPIEGLHAAGDRAWIEIGAEDLERPDAHFRHHLELLGKVHETLSGLRLGETPGEGAGWSRRSITVLALAVHAGLLAASLAGLAMVWLAPGQTTERERLVATGLALGLAVAAPWLFLLSRRLRGTAWMAWMVADFAVTGLAGFLLGGVLLVRTTNVDLDSAPPSLATVAVTWRGCLLECSRGSGKSKKTSYHQLSAADCVAARRPAMLAAFRRQDSKCSDRAAFDFTVRLAPWRPGQAPFELDPGAARWERMVVGSRVAVPLHGGAWGIEWVDPLEFAPAP